jgi:hypothetical protein
LSDTEIGSFDFGAIMALPEPTGELKSKTFRAAGRDWTFTISTLAAKSAETFFEVVHTNPRNMTPETVIIPGAFGQAPTKFVIKPGIYLSTLRSMVPCLVSPKLSFTELAVFGHKIGDEFAPIMNWFNEEFGASLTDVQEEIDSEGEDSGAAA